MFVVVLIIRDCCWVGRVETGGQYKRANNNKWQLWISCWNIIRKKRISIERIMSRYRVDFGFLKCFFFFLLRLLLIKNLCGVFYSAPFKGKWGEKNNRNIIEGNKETREFQKIKQIITFQRETQTTKFLFKLHRLKNWRER